MTRRAQRSIERAQRLADARAAAPVLHVAREPRDAAAAAPPASGRVTRVSRVANTNASTRARAVREAIDEVQQHPAVSLHRSADVARSPRSAARASRRSPARQVDQVAAAHQVPPQQRPQIDAPRRGALPAPGPPHAQRQGRLASSAPRAFELGVGEVGEVLRARHAGRAPRADGRASVGGRARLDVLELDTERRPWRRRRDDARPLAEREQRQAGRRRAVRAEEQIERLIEPREVLCRCTSRLRSVARDIRRGCRRRPIRARGSRRAGGRGARRGRRRGARGRTAGRCRRGAVSLTLGSRRARARG